jgi:RND superfamily putative drug exporter
VRGVQVLALRDPAVYRVSVATTDGPAQASTEDFVRDLRGGDLRASLADIQYDVGGESAMRLDATQALFEGLPLMLGVLLALVLVFFMVAMRSIVLPVKAILLVVISLGASLGGLLLLSTTTLGARMIGWSQPEELHPIVPITIVAIAVALSTDYEVILISRMAERYRETGDNTDAITYGVARTGRVISSAAAIMIAVFLGFALSDVTPLKQLGVGLAFAVLIDATLIRGVLVPASMQLLGRWNWWFPTVGRARRAHRHQRHGPAGEPPTESEHRHRTLVDATTGRSDLTPTKGTDAHA